MTAMASRPLVIGVGNRDRGDDAVGPVVADAVADRCGDAVESIVVEGDLADLALRWGDAQTVVVVDAMVGGAAPGTVVELDGLTERFGQEAINQVVVLANRSWCVTSICGMWE